MSVPQTVAEVLSKHVVLEVESIDRMYLNVYVPQLQAVEGTLKFIRIHRGHKVASTHMVEPITRQFVSSIERFAKDNRTPLITFKKGQRKDDFAKQQRKDFRHREGVVFIGKAQEKCTVYRTEKRRNPRTKRTYPWIVKSTTLVNHYYFYCIDADFGPFFLKFCSYFPYNAKLCLNGHEYLKQQLKQHGIPYQALENGILSCKDPQQLQLLCDRLSVGKIDALLRKWLRLLPHPFALQDRQAGYRYQLSILQIELSLTQVLDQPLNGRIFLKKSSEKTWTSVAPNKFNSSLIVGSPKPPPVPFVPESSLMESSPPCTSTTKARALSSITRKVEPYEPKPLSTTPTTSTSAKTCATCPRSGASAFKPTDDFSMCSASATTASLPKKPFKESIALSEWHHNEPPLCTLPIPKCKLSGAPCCCSNCFPQVFPIAISAHTSHLCSANLPKTSLKDK